MVRHEKFRQVPCKVIDMLQHGVDAGHFHGHRHLGCVKQRREILIAKRCCDHVKVCGPFVERVAF